jgi:endonuclease YncB( thermonuclease family)
MPTPRLPHASTWLERIAPTLTPAAFVRRVSSAAIVSALIAFAIALVALLVSMSVAAAAAAATPTPNPTTAAPSSIRSAEFPHSRAPTALAVSGAARTELRGRVVSVTDGDTLTLLDAGRQQHRVRLADIDAPEMGHGSKRPGQPYGMASKKSLSDMAHGREVRATCRADDRYGRNVCRIYVAELDVNLEQVRRGMAWPYIKYLEDPSLLAIAERARQSRVGLWSGTSPSAPWDWRSLCWNGGMCPGAGE